MQLSFTIDNTPLLLDENTSVQLAYYNPFFAIRDFPGDKGVNIEIPVNTHNRAMLGNPATFDKQRSSNDREFTGFAVTFGGWTAMIGTLVIQSATESSYSGWLRTNAGNLGKAEREKYIFENTKFTAQKQFSNQATYVPGTDDYCCPRVINKKFFDDIGKKINDNGDEVSMLAYNFNRTTASLINARNPADGTIMAASDTENVVTNPKDLDVYVVSPMLFINHVLKEIFEQNGLYIDSNYLASSSLFKNLCIYNNFDIINIDFNDNGGWETINWFEADTQKATAAIFDTLLLYYNGYFSYNNLLPKVPFKDFLIGIQNLSNTCTHFKARNKIDILDREAILSGTADDISQYFAGTWELGEQKDVTLKFTFEPDGNDVILSDRFTDLDDRRDDIGEPVALWTDLQTIVTPQLGEIRYITNYLVFAEYKWVQKVSTDANGDETTTDMLGWEHISLGFQNGFYNEGKDEEEEIPTKLFPFPEDMIVEQRGNMSVMKSETPDFGLRIASNAGNTYGVLEWEGDNGLIATRWPLTAKFLSSRLAVNGKAQLPVNVLDWVIRRLPYKKRGREGEFIIEEMTVTLNSNSISPTEFKGYKI